MEKSLLVILTTLVVSASCASTPEIHSSAHYKLNENKMHAVAYDARGRGAYILRKDGKSTLCAEPAPDAVANETSSRTSSVDLQTSLTYASIAAQLGLGANDTQSAIVAIADVAERTEVVLVLREALYRVCEANLNGVLDEESTARLFDEILKTARSFGQRKTTAALTTALNAAEDSAIKQEILGAIVTIALAETVAGADESVKPLLLQQAQQQQQQQQRQQQQQQQQQRGGR